MAEYLFKTDKINACKDCPCANTIDTFYIWCKLDYSIIEGIRMQRLVEKEDLPKPSWCPLIEVPAHGDLIERNELPLNHITDYNLEGHSVVDIEDVLNAPTVLEATGGRKK